MNKILIFFYLTVLAQSFLLPSNTINIKPIGFKICLKTKCLMNNNNRDNNIHNKTISSSALILLPKPIPLLSFDEILLNLYSIKKIYISRKSDMMIVEFKNKTGIYYIKRSQFEKMAMILTNVRDNIEYVDDLLMVMNQIRKKIYKSEADLINDTINEKLKQHNITEKK